MVRIAQRRGNAPGSSSWLYLLVLRVAISLALIHLGEWAAATESHVVHDGDRIPKVSTVLEKVRDFETF